MDVIYYRMEVWIIISLHVLWKDYQHMSVITDLYASIVMG